MLIFLLKDLIDSISSGVGKRYLSHLPKFSSILIAEPKQNRIGIYNARFWFLKWSNDPENIILLVLSNHSQFQEQKYDFSESNQNQKVPYAWANGSGKYLKLSILGSYHKIEEKNKSPILIIDPLSVANMENFLKYIPPTHK